MTVPEQISVGKVCEVLCINEMNSGKGSGGQLDFRIPKLIDAVTQALSWMYDSDPTDSRLTKIGNYLISICNHKARAQYILSIGGGGTVAPITPTTLPDPQSFIVSASSFIADGASSIVIPEYIGYNLLFFRGGIQQSTVNTELSYYTWDRDNGAMTISPAAVTSEIFFLMPTR